MNVAELAKELGLPASTIIQQCQRFGIDASWAGADLSSTDVVVLRAELALDDGLLDLTGHEDVVPPAPAPAEEPSVAADPDPAAAEPDATPAAALPPTAVGSLPELADDLAEELAAPSVRPGALQTGGPIGASALGSTSGGTPSSFGSAPSSEGSARLDRGVGASGRWLGAAVVVVVAAVISANVWVVLFLWPLALVLTVLALVDANRARGRASLHPERVRGLGPSYVLLGASFLVLLLLAGTAWLVVRPEPARSVPGGLGDLAAVQNARWGYQRFTLVKDDGWQSPAKATGSCWAIGPGEEPRAEHRTEIGDEDVHCNQEHEAEVLRVFSYDRDADSSHPGAPRLRARGAERCVDDLAAAIRADGGSSADLELFVEFPDAEAWADGDHDLACVAVTAPRRGGLLGD